MTRGKVVLLPFPFDDLSATKVRPALCLTDVIGPHHHIVVAFISSRIPAQPLASDLVIENNSPDFAATGLKVSSVVRLRRLMTITSVIVQRILGEFSSPLLENTSEKLIDLFTLSQYPS